MLGVMAGAACNGGRPNLGPDETPPELAFASEVPLWTRETSATLSVSAKDPSGVAKVWCRVGNSAVAAERKEDGNYSCGVALQQNTSNDVVIWAVDGANSSGEGRDAPYMLNCAIVQDENALAVSLNGAAPAAYYDESKMMVGTAAPPVYERNGIGLEVVGPGGTIHKAVTRLAARPPLSTSPADLEGSNPDNLPWLQFAVSLTGAPIAAAGYTIEAKSEGKTQTYSGDLILWRSPQSADGATIGNVLFNLPLDSVRIPTLTTAAGPVALKVAVDVTDKAGNKGGEEVQLKFEVIGPPLNIVVDSGYPGLGLPDSTYHYKIADGTYDKLFDTSASIFGGQVRLARIVVKNPASQPVALDVSGITGSWTMTETWSGNQRASGTTIFNNNGRCPPDDASAMSHATKYAPLGRSPVAQQDPGAASVGWNGVAAMSNVSSLAELRDAAAPTVGGRYIIVPAAVGSAPGVVSLYVSRPLAVSRAGDAPALGPPPYKNDKGTLFTYASEMNNTNGCCARGFRKSAYFRCYSGSQGAGDKCSLHDCTASGWDLASLLWYCEPGPLVCPTGNWLGDNYGLGTECTNCSVRMERACACSTWTQAQIYNMSTYYQQLSTASEAVSLNFAPATHPTDDAGNVYGVANEWAASIAISSGFTH
jgi:hypothetical protein